MDYHTLAVLHALPTLAMVGVIWIVQLVHYPLFLRVGAAGFLAYEGQHRARIGFVVMPLMLAEVVLNLLLWWRASTSTQHGLALAGLILLALLWASTFLLQVPCHRRLERGFHAATVRRLVATNWVRTAGWTLRGAAAAALVLQAGP